MNEQLRELLAEILDLPTSAVRPEMRRSDTEAWDSLNHLRLITAIESTFGATFTMDEISKLQTPAELQTLIEARKSLPRQSA